MIRMHTECMMSSFSVRHVFNFHAIKFSCVVWGHHQCSSLTLCAWANLKLKISGWTKRCATSAAKWLLKPSGSGGMLPQEKFQILRLLLHGIASETLTNKTNDCCGINFVYCYSKISHLKFDQVVGPVTRILVLESLVPQTQIFTEKYGLPLEKLVCMSWRHVF